MQSQLYRKANARAKRWAKGFTEKNLNFNFCEQRLKIELFLSKPTESLKNLDFITFSNSCKILSIWYAADFLEKFLIAKKDFLYPLKQYMLWDSIDPLMYCYGKKGDIRPVVFSGVYLTVCNLLILGKNEQARRLLEYSSPDKINFKSEPVGSICNYVSKMCNVFLKSESVQHEFPGDLNSQYNSLLQYITSGIDNKGKINEIINDVCEFHLSRNKEFQEFYSDHTAMFPSEIIASLLLLHNETREIMHVEHPLVKNLLIIITDFGNIGTEELFAKVEQHLVTLS